MEANPAQSGAALMARFFLLPAWMAPRLQKLGHVWWDFFANIDPRRFWRWMAGNWHRVAAWWLTVGLVLSVLVLLGALVTWQSPDAVVWRVVMASQRIFITGGKLAGAGGLLVLALSLPIILPALVLIGAGALVVTLALGLLGPVLLVCMLAGGLLLGFAVFKVSGRWLVDFVLKSLQRGDEQATLAMRLRAALGLHGASSVTVQGTPHMMTGDEQERFTASIDTSKGAPLLLGKVNGKPFMYWTQKHFFVTAAARSGKGRDLIIPNLKRYPESVFVLDPKGENFAATAQYRQTHGNRIAAFDPYGLTGAPSARFNPLDMGKGGHMVRVADYIAEALVIGPNDHWHESARGLIRMLTLHLMTAPQEKLRERGRDLPALRELLTGYLELTLTEMKESEALNGLVSRLAESFLSVPANERGGIVNTARRGTKWLDNPELANMFRSDVVSTERAIATLDNPPPNHLNVPPKGEVITFDDLRDESKRLSVFVCLPPDVFGTYPEVCRLLTTFALDTMMRELTGRRRSVMFILDELAQLQRLPIVEQAFTLGAGYGMQVWAVFQSVAQASKLYALDALYGSSGARCFFNLADPESVEYASKCASGVLSPADIRHMPQLGMLALLDNANPLYVDRLGPPVPPEEKT